MILDDNWPELWTGDNEAIQAAAGRWIDSGDGTLAEPEVNLVGKVAVVIVDGLLTEAGWRELAKAIDLACTEPEAEFLLIAINSRAQSWRGCSAAFRALKSARKSLLTCAFIHYANGLAVNLAVNCHAVFASGVSEFGHLVGCHPFGEPSGYPSLESTNETLANEVLKCEHEIPRRAVECLASGIINGEVAEAYGLAHFLQPMFDFTAEFLNAIGAKH